jgi:hypothetical protein
MKVSNISNLKSVLIPALISLSFCAFAGDPGGNAETARAYSFCNKANVKSKVNMSIEFQEHDSFSYDRQISYPNPLFVGASFKVKRPIETFNIDKLTNVNDISTLSRSQLSNVRRTQFGLNFTSAKLVGFNVMACHNVVNVYSWAEFLSQDDFSEVKDVLEVEGCFKYQVPSIVTVQRSYRCSALFNKNKLVTFYSEARDGGTNILSLSINSLLKRPNRMMKNIMKNTIEGTLKSLPAVIEKLQ